MTQTFRDLMSTQRIMRSNGNNLFVELMLSDNTTLYLDYVNEDWVVTPKRLPRQFSRILAGFDRTVFIKVDVPQTTGIGEEVWFAVGGFDSLRVKTRQAIIAISVVERSTVSPGVDDVQIIPIHMPEK